VIVADTSGLVALLDAGEPEHERVRDAIEDDAGPLLAIDFVLAETDYLVLRRLGAEAERGFVAQVKSGAIHREPVTSADIDRASEILERYADQELGLTDASVMAVAERLDAPVLTLDRRHFSPFRDRRGRALALLPP
jgi:predicted nucleic acid-binding protein